jgi:outer membrane protein
MTNRPSFRSAAKSPESSVQDRRPTRTMRVLFALCVSMALAPFASAAQLTLDAAIRLALQRNQSLKVSAFTPDIARANLLAEYGAFDPALTFRRNYSEGTNILSITPLVRSLTQQDDYSLGLEGLTPWGATYSLSARADNQRGTFNQFSNRFETFGGITVTQPLLRGFGFGANLAGVRIAKADRNIADWLHRETIINIITNVIITYNNVIQFRENVRIAKGNRDLNAVLVDENQRRNRIGDKTDADVIQAQARLASREENVLLFQRSAADFENQLRQLVGETVYPVNGPELELEPLPPAPSISVQASTDLKKAFELRPDYQRARLGVTKRRVNSTFAQNQLLPRVDFVGSFGYSGQDADFGAARRQVRDRDARSYSAGVVVSVPLTFAEGRGRARAAKLSLRQSEEDLVRLEQEIAIDIAEAAGQIETAHLRVAAARNALTLAERSLEAEQKKFNAGTSSTFLVLQSQEQLAQTQNSYARALGDQRRAIAAYDREIGTTLLTWGITTQP